MEISILINFLFFIWIEIFPHIFNQDGNLNNSVSFRVSLVSNSEGACVKPTLNRYFVSCNVGLLFYAMLAWELPYAILAQTKYSVH